MIPLRFLSCPIFQDIKHSKSRESSRHGISIVQFSFPPSSFRSGLWFSSIEIIPDSSFGKHRSAGSIRVNVVCEPFEKPRAGQPVVRSAFLLLSQYQHVGVRVVMISEVSTIVTRVAR